MSRVTPENVEGRGGWKVTPLGRIVRPIKMRPERPLPLPQVLEVSKSKEARKKKHENNGKDEKKRKRREKVPDTKARRRTIDMMRWGSVHLKGMFMDLDVRGRAKGLGEEAVEHSAENDGGETSEEEEDAGDSVVDPTDMKEKKSEAMPDPSPYPTLPAATAAAVPPEQIKTNPFTPSTPSITTSLPDDNTDINLEKTKSLHLLQSLFGGEHDGEWRGRESVDSDVDEESIRRSERGMGVGGKGIDLDYEVVPVDVDMGGNMVGEGAVDMEDDKREGEGGGAQVERQDVPKRPTAEKQRQSTKLKDLFAPREQEGVFISSLRAARPCPYNPMPCSVCLMSRLISKGTNATFFSQLDFRYLGILILTSSWTMRCSFQPQLRRQRHSQTRTLLHPHQQQH